MTGGPGARADRRLVLVTRPEGDAERTIEALAARGIGALAWPLTRIVMATEAIELPEGAGAILFTSGNAVRAFARLSRRRDLPALCVGDRTAGAAREAGFRDVRSAAGDASDLAALAADAGIRSMYHPRGREVAADLARMLGPRGIMVAEEVVYAAEEVAGTPPEVERALRAGEVAIVTAWSPRGARLLADRLSVRPSADRAAMRGVAISERAARPLAGLGLADVGVAERPDGAAMLDAIAAILACLRR